MKTIQELAIPAIAALLASAPNQDDVAAAIREMEEISPPSDFLDDENGGDG